jgi:putative endonuclease
VTPGDPRRGLGEVGERLVAARYEAAGYALLDRNWRCREGELDLVVMRGRTIVFCEVKTRRSRRFGAPIEAVTPTKARRLRVLAARWLASHEHHGTARFDVASVLAHPNGEFSVDIVEAAF